MLRKRLVAGIAAAVTAATVVAIAGGCASSAGSTVSLPDAKAETLKFETQIATFVPAAYVTDTQQTKTSKVIFPCLGHSDQSYWPGTTTLSLKPALDNDSVLNQMKDFFSQKSDWSVVQNSGNDGKPTLTIKSDSGYSFTVAFVDGPQLSITALSACFPTSSVSGQATY